MATYDIALFAGHGQGDPGAVGNGYQEHALALELRDKVYNLIKDKLSVHLAINPYNNNPTRGNTYRQKFAVSIHFNAGGGTGAEVLVPLNEGYLSMDVDVLNRFRALGSVSRGVKSRNYHTEATSQRSHGTKLSGTDYYKEIREAWANGISLSIVEVAFVDTRADIANYVAKKDEYARALANAILKACGKAELSVAPVVTPVVQSGGIVLYKGDKDGHLANWLGSHFGYGVDRNTTKADLSKYKEVICVGCSAADYPRCTRLLSGSNSKLTLKAVSDYIQTV